MAKQKRDINLPAPYLKRIWLDPERIDDREAYPFCLPFLSDDFDLRFERAITIIVGENGTGKSTLLEGIAALAGYDGAGGGKGYRPVDHSNALEVRAKTFKDALRASWLPKITKGWFFRAESFFSVARYLDEARGVPGHSGRTFSPIRTAKASCASSRSAASGKAFHLRRAGVGAVARAPDQFLKLLQMMDESERIQVIMATHSPLLMAYPNATLLRLTKYGLEPTTVESTDHYKTLREFFEDPKGFVEAAIAE